MSEAQRKSAKAALKKIADAISENEGRIRMLKNGEDAASRKASNTANKWSEADEAYRRSFEESQNKSAYQLPTATERHGRNATNLGDFGGYADQYHRALGWEENQKRLGNWGQSKEIQDIRNRGEKISVRRKGIEAKNDSLKTEASDIAMTERQHFEKILADMKARREKGISTEYADNLMIQGRGTPPVDIVPKNTRQEGNLVAGTIAAAGAAGAAGAAYRSSWSQKKDAERK